MVNDSVCCVGIYTVSSKLFFRRRGVVCMIRMAEADQLHPHPPEMMVDDGEGSEIDPLSDPEERRVLFAALDSFR